MIRFLLTILPLATAINVATAATATPEATVSAFIADFKAWNDRAIKSGGEMKGLTGEAMIRKEWELGDRARAEYYALVAKYTAPGFESRLYSGGHDPATETIVNVQTSEQNAVVTTQQPPDPKAAAFFPEPTMREFVLARSAERWLLVSIKERYGAKGAWSETLAADPARKKAEDPRRLIQTYEWDVIEPALEGKQGRAALNTLLRLGQRCELRLERPLFEGVLGARSLPPTVHCLKQLTDRYGNEVMAMVTLFLSLPRPAPTFADLLAVLPEAGIKDVSTSQEAILDWPHRGRTVYRDDNLPELQQKFGKRKEVKALEGRPARDAIESLMGAGFQCGFRDWQPRERGAASVEVACSQPAPFDLKGCFGFLYFELAGPAALDPPEAIFWSTEHAVRNVTVRCGSFNSLSFDP